MSDPSWALTNAEESERTTPNNPPASEDTASDQLRQRLVESLDHYPVACWTPRNLAGRVMGVIGGELDHWEKAARENGERLARVREALASFDGRGVLAPGHVNLDIPTAGEVLDKIREALDEPVAPATAAADAETTTRVFAALHRSAEDTVTRVITLHEQWVKAGPPPFGVPLARWWDRRLVELHDAILPPGEEPARTTANTPAGHDDGPTVADCAADDRRWFG